MDLLEQFKKTIEKLLLDYYGSLDLDRRWLLLLVEAPANQGQPRESGHLHVQLSYPRRDHPTGGERTELVLHLAALSVGVSYPFASIELAPEELVLIDLELGKGVWIVPNAVVYRRTEAGTNAEEEVYASPYSPVPDEEENRDSDQEMPQTSGQEGDRAVWPKPTMEEPDPEQLEEWWLMGGCYATDGCWVAPDEVCDHHHPSWLLRLGYI